MVHNYPSKEPEVCPTYSRHSPTLSPSQPAAEKRDQVSHLLDRHRLLHPFQHEGAVRGHELVDLGAGNVPHSPVGERCRRDPTGAASVKP